VDVLNPNPRTFTVQADGTLPVDLEAQRALILVPQDQLRAQ
jgi:hypothetical protein